MITATDFFCGMGGSSTGLVEAGFTVKLAANHWARAIETHSANHPDTEHLCADLQAVDLRYLPKTDVLWASPICTELSPAGGRRKKGHQLDLFEDHGHVPTAAFERTRVTFWEVIRACEIHRYKAVLIENVVEAADWELFDVWLAGMTTLGYEHQFISVSAAHVGDENNPRAPQWRDRMYIRFTLKGIKVTPIEPHPLAWCFKCDTAVNAVQWWKPKRKHAGRKIGKYGAQYLYVCPIGNHGSVEPFVVPASAAIDWDDLGTRIGDRTRPLAAATMRRIRHGLDMLERGDFGDQMVLSVNHSGEDGRPFDPTVRPMPTATIKRGEALVVPAGGTWNDDTTNINDPLRAMLTRDAYGLMVAAAGNTYDGASGAGNNYIRAYPVDGSPSPTQTTSAQLGIVTMLRNHGGSTAVANGPLATFTGGFNHGLVVKSQGGQLEDRHAIGTTATPLPTSRAASSDFLVIPYRKGAKPHDTGRPLSAMTTREGHALMRPSIDVDDCLFRMLKPRESATAQRFPREYVITGNGGEQQMQSGNAVAVNVAHWLGADTARALEGDAA